MRGGQGREEWRRLERRFKHAVGTFGDVLGARSVRPREKPPAYRRDRGEQHSRKIQGRPAARHAAARHALVKMGPISSVDVSPV